MIEKFEISDNFKSVSNTNDEVEKNEKKISRENDEEN